MSTSPNPWDPDSGELPECDRSSEEIIDDIRFFLRRWPGKISSMITEQERHSRLVRIIAGYPEIRIGVTPLDSPFELASKRSFEMVLALDSKKSKWKTRSLWTELLGIDLQFSENSEKKTEQILAALFIGLGEDPPESKKDEPKLSRAAQALLAELFTYTKLGSWHQVCRFMREPSGEMKSGNTTFLDGGTDFGHGGGKIVLTCEMKRIKNWVREVIPPTKKGDSLAQRYLRGASSFIQVSMSELRGSYALDYGNYSSEKDNNLIGKKSSTILVDGGGRLMILVDGNSNRSLRAPPADLVEQLFSINLDEFVINDDGNEVFAESNSSAKSDNPKLLINLPIGASMDVHVQENLNPIPPKSFDSFSQFCDELSSSQIGRTPQGESCRVIPPWNETCPRCNLDIDYSGREQSDIENNRGGFCWQHRLIHLIGHRQRTRDSALNQPARDENRPNLKFPPTERSVNAIATIDGNSIGWLLNHSRFSEESGLKIDGIRRRSMRFNAHWWVSLFGAMNDANLHTPDRIACWVSAGDDIVLAAYGKKDEEVDECVESLKEMLILFSENLNEKMNIELTSDPNGPLVTFCASISPRLEGYSISDMVSNGSNLEIKSKKMWTKIHRDGPSERTMISAEKLERENFDIHRMLLEGTEWTEDLLRQVADEHSLNVDDSDDLNKLYVICSRAEIVDAQGKLRILISEKKGSVEGLPVYEKIELPSTEAGITNLVLIQSQ